VSLTTVLAVHPLAVIMSEVVINSWCVSQLSQVNPDISVFQVDLIRLESLLLYGVFQRS